MDERGLQVGPGNIIVDQPTLPSLVWSAQGAHCGQGMLVSWSGLDATVTKRRNVTFFRVRCWARNAVVMRLLGVCDRLLEGTPTEPLL